MKENDIARLKEDAGRQQAMRETLLRSQRELLDEVRQSDIQPLVRRHQTAHYVLTAVLVLLFSAVGNVATAQRLPAEKVYSSELFGQKAAVETTDQILKIL